MKKKQSTKKDIKNNIKKQSEKRFKNNEKTMKKH